MSLLPQHIYQVGLVFPLLSHHQDYIHSNCIHQNYSLRVYSIQLYPDTMKFYGNQEDDLPLDDLPPDYTFEERIEHAQTNMGTRTAFFYGNKILSPVE